MRKLFAYLKLFSKFYGQVPGLVTLAVVSALVAVDLVRWWVQANGFASANYLAISAAIQIVGVLFLVAYLVSRTQYDSEKRHDASETQQLLAAQTTATELLKLTKAVDGLVDECALNAARDQLREQIEDFAANATEEQVKLRTALGSMRREFDHRLESSAAELRIALAALLREEIDKRLQERHDSDPAFHIMGIRILQMRQAIINDHMSGRNRTEQSVS